MKKTFSIILPIYHQSQQIPHIVTEYEHELRKLHTSFELILVVNGNDEESFHTASRLAKKYRSLNVIFIKEAGWGNAILHGISQASGEFICYTNSARTRVADLLAMLKLAQRNPSVVIKATRILHINLLRKIGSTLYNIECRLLLHTPVWDVNGTPKIIPHKIIKKLHLSSKDDLIDAELVAKCLWNTIPILEVPILFPTRFSGKSTTKILSALKMYLGLFRIRNLRKNPMLLTGDAFGKQEGK